MLLELDATEFTPDRVDGDAATPVFFHATWCGFCSRVAPRFRERATAADRPFLSVDISDDGSPVWDAYNIHVVPTIMLFRRGVPVARRGGVLSPEDVDALLDAADV